MLFKVLLKFKPKTLESLPFGLSYASEGEEMHLLQCYIAVQIVHSFVFAYGSSNSQGYIHVCSTAFYGRGVGWTTTSFTSRTSTATPSSTSSASTTYVRMLWDHTMEVCMYVYVNIGKHPTCYTGTSTKSKHMILKVNGVDGKQPNHCPTVHDSRWRNPVEQQKMSLVWCKPWKIWRNLGLEDQQKGPKTIVGAAVVGSISSLESLSSRRLP